MIITMCRLSVFGNFPMLEPTSSNVITWTQALQNAGYEMLPNIIQPTDPVFLPDGPRTPPQFIQFSETTKTEARHLLRLANRRIDTECTMIQSEPWQEALKKNLDGLLKLLHVSDEFIQDTKSARIAYYSDAMLEEPTTRAFHDFYRGNNFGLSFDDSGMTDCKEWMHRFNQTGTLGLPSGEETCNFILTMENSLFRTISPERHETKEYQGLRVSADINTLGENDTPRFSINDMDKFGPAAMEAHIGVLQSITEILK